ncbi:threonine-phosphate decarboxylase [Tropicimonas sp. S265A]|uniref:threonine-phosphate decarboxylase n=1 Tax=Tropicimonas sp. S265A TaxID=3415134 RepID=UPI003C7A1DEE
MSAGRDHGGGVDAAAQRYGGTRADWLDLSTGINPIPYPVDSLPAGVWTTLPDSTAQERLLHAARRFWNVPDGLGILAAPGASSLIAQMPHTLGAQGTARIAQATYNEWAASFRQAGWTVTETAPHAEVDVRVHPNNPDGALAEPVQKTGETFVIDESFCDPTPEKSFLSEDFFCKVIDTNNFFIFKSFGKFWGCAGLRLGFLIGPPPYLEHMAARLGPWPVSGPALELGARALEDPGWADQTRARLRRDSDRLDALMTEYGARAPRGTTLFRLYEVADAAAWQDRLARHHIWTRIFPYSKTWIRLGLPGQEPDWVRLGRALKDL